MRGGDSARGSAFPAEIQSAVCGNGHCLVAVISQRLRFRDDLNIRVPECEILMATHAVKNFIRSREFLEIVTAIETGADHGMWTFQRYNKWLEGRKNFFIPDLNAEPPDGEPADDPAAGAALPPLLATSKSEPGPVPPTPDEVHRIDIDPDEGNFGKILKAPK